MKVLITGGTGTISSGLVQECVNRGIDVYAITRGRNKERNIVGANYLYCNLRDPEDVKQAIDQLNFDVVVDCQTYTLSQLKVSLDCFSNHCLQYVFISTAGVYNNMEGNERITEKSRKEFRDWSYTKNKLDCEKYIIEYCENSSLKYTIIRPTVTYGNYRVPFPVSTRTPAWSFFQRLLDGKPMLACDNVKYSIIHISDFSRAVVSLFGNPIAYNEDYHISSNENDVFWDDVVKESGKILGVKPIIIHVPLAAFKKVYPEIYEDIKYNKSESRLLDDKKIVEATRFKSQINLKEGLNSIIPAMKNEFIYNKMKVDKQWNDYCDATILYAFKNNLLSDIEQERMMLYFENNGEKSFIESFRKAMKNNQIWKIHTLLRTIKKLLKV